MTDRRAGEILWFSALAVALVAFLVRDAWLHGYVLGQAEFLFDYLPWQANRPAGWRVRNPLLGDPPMVFYPFLFHARSEILSGRFPLWSSAIGGGQPFFGAIQTAVLSPFTLFDYAFPFPWSFTLDVAARLFAGAVGMYVFLRRLPLSAGAAVFGGIAWLLNPFSIVWLEHPLSAVAAWLPWMLLAAGECARRMTNGAVAFIACITALMLFSGHPETAFKVLLVAGPYGLFVGWRQGTLARSTWVVGLGVLFGALLTSVQLAPFLEYASGSRVLAERAAAGTPLFTSPAISFVTAFVPDFFGTPLRRDFLIGGNYCEQQVYAGLSTWILASLALAHRTHRGKAVFFLVAGAIAAAIMYGTPVAIAATWLLPPLRVAALSRFGLLVITGLVVAAAIGLDELLHRLAAAPRDLRRLEAAGVRGAAGVALMVLGFLLATRPMLDRAHHWTATLESTSVAALLLTASLGLLLTAARLGARRVACAFCALIAADLLWFAEGFHPFLPRPHAFPPTAATTLVQSDRDLFRVAGWMDVLLPNTALVYGLGDVRSYDGIGIREYMDLLDVGFHYTGATHQLVNVATPRLLDLLNVKYILTPPDIDLPPDRFERVLDGTTRVYRNRTVQPRAFLVDQQVTLTGNAARRAIRDTLDLTRVAVVESPLEASHQPEPAAAGMGTATLRRYEDQRIGISTRTDGRRLLVVTDAYYPGWIATVDGREIPILRADYAFRAVPIPAGDHVVDFIYRPKSVQYGMYGTHAGLALVAFLFANRFIRRPKAVPRRP
jgi:Bacterial membrane protein YfhO